MRTYDVFALLDAGPYMASDLDQNNRHFNCLNLLPYPDSKHAVLHPPIQK
jgi:hypothetical protein